jgi:hypothetical protein
MTKTLLAFGLPLLLQPQAANVPRFDQYRVTEIYKGKPAQPVIKSAADREFRTRIRDGAKDGPNFAGHFTIVDWGCGAGCVSIAIVDAANGTTYNPPFKVLGWDMVTYEGRIAASADNFAPLDFHRDSRLLIARGCPEEKNCGSYSYEWTGAEFKLLSKIPATPLAK